MREDTNSTMGIFMAHNPTLKFMEFMASNAYLAVDKERKGDSHNEFTCFLPTAHAARPNVCMNVYPTPAQSSDDECGMSVCLSLSYTPLAGCLKLT